MKKGFVVFFAMFFTVFASSFASASGQSMDKGKVARDLATFLVSGRVVVAQHQTLINDESKGNKGFDAAYFSGKVAAEFKKRSGIDINKLEANSDGDKLLLQAVEAAKEAVKNSQSLINIKGIGYKGFIPAAFGKETGRIFYKKTGVMLKQTSDKYRNSYNKPDAFELAILNDFISGSLPKGKGIGKEMEVGSNKIYRYVQPIYIKAGCLKCHGEPKGERDIAGRKKEGYKVGELRGAISVTIP